MVTVLPSLRNVFHTLCNAPAPNVFSTSTTLPRLVPHNPYSNHPINTTDGCYNNPLVIPGYSPSKRYQPYPQPQVLPPGQLLVFSQRESIKRHRPQSRLVDPRPNGGAVQPLTPACVSHSEPNAGAITAANLNPPTTEDYDVEMGEGAYIREADLLDVEMEDVFLPPVPAIIVTPPDDSGQQPPAFD